MTVSEGFRILGMLIFIIWGFIIAAGMLIMGWDWFRDWDARRRIRNLIAQNDIAEEAQAFLHQQAR